MRKGWLAVAALAVAAPVVAQAPQGILTMAINDLAAGWTPYGPNQTAKGIADPGVQGGNAVRIDIRKAGANPWDDGANAKITSAVRKGDPLVLAFWARAPKVSDGQTVALPFAGITQSHAPYGQIVKGTPTIGKAWQMVQLRGVADADYPVGELQAALQLSVAKLQIDLGPVFVLDMKKGK